MTCDKCFRHNYCLLVFSHCNRYICIYKIDWEVHFVSLCHQPAPILRVQPLNVCILLTFFIMCTHYYINNDENGIECEAGNTEQDSNWKKLNGLCVHKVARYTKVHIYLLTYLLTYLLQRPQVAHLLRSWVRILPGAWIFVCCECRMLSGRGLCDKLITSPEESYRLCCVVVCDLETSRIGAPYRNDISNLRVKNMKFPDTVIETFNKSQTKWDSRTCCTMQQLALPLQSHWPFS
jgi:hypothetical protein